ncbi:MAG: BLUF domain-containing protein [Hymenobacter sp.]|nr:BLUF domain-containing protein [Hymenobacter sp.]
MSIHQIIYRSTATRPLSEAELGRLVSQARIYNYSQSITGILLYAEQQFLQVLEGEKTAVEELYDRIAEDPRHTDLTIVLDGPAPQPFFPAWNMGFNRVAPAALARLGNYLDPQHWAVLLPRTYSAQEVITDLLREFVDEQTAASRLPGGGPG